MDTSYRLFVQSCVILLLHVEFSLTDDFDITTIYNFQDASPVIQDDIAVFLPSSMEIHARNNARGLPFLSKAGTILEPNIAVDIQTCTFFNKSCNWKLSNFSYLALNSPLKLKGKTETFATEIIEDGEESQLQLFQDEFSFTFSGSQSTGTLSIYLMDSFKGLSEANMYYFTIRYSGHRYQNQFYSKFYRCTNESKTESSIITIPHYGPRQCKFISDSTVSTGNYNNYYYWQKQVQFFVKTKQTEVSLTATLSGNTRSLFHWNDDFPVKVQYYKIGTTGMKGSITRNFGPNELPCVVLTHESGSIVSETFIPRYSEVCLSVVYHRGTQGSIALQIVRDDGRKLHLKQLQTSSLGDGWVSSVYNAQLPEEKSHNPIRIELTAEGTYNIAIQRIAGCNSEGLEEDIYVASLNKMEVYAYDVAVNRSASDSKEKLDCLNGGLYDNERNSCICPAGFTGKICEFSCGPDRYDSKCSGRCSISGKGCRKLKLCRPKLGCNCAPGFEGKLCDTTCGTGRHGASCNQKCGNCQHKSCDIYTGHCPSGCQEGYYPPFCKAHYKHLRTGPKVVSIDYHTLQLMFSIKPEDLAGSGTPVFYQIQIKDDQNQFYTWTELEPISLPAAQIVETNITQLKSGTNYEVRVVLLDIDGNSYQGQDVPVANGFTKCIVPEVDYNLTIVTVGQKEFQIEWEYTAESTSWCRLTHFEVEMNAVWKWEQYYKGDMKTFTFFDRLPGEKYKVRVRGVSVDGSLPFSQPLTVTTQDEAPQIVLTPSIVSRTHNQIEVSWKEPFFSREQIQKYKVTYECQKLLACNEEDCSFSADYVEVSKTSVILQGLIPHAQYLISIAAKSALYGPEVHLSATTDMAEPETSPGLAASTIIFCTNSTLTVQWERPKNCTQLNGYLYGYQYEFFEPRNPSPLYEGSTEDTSATFSGLNPHTEYEVKVYLKTSAGRSSSHPLIINASTRATGPGKVEQLTVYKVGRRIIGLRWGLPKETYGDIKSFTISYRSEHQQVKNFTITPAPCIAWPGLYCHTISSLQADKEYTVTVQAKNKEVNEDGAIAQVVTTTKENAPLAPEYIKTVSQTETSLTIEWGLPNLINGVLRSFLVNIEETDSVNTTDCCQYFPIQEVAVKYEQANYQIQLNNLKPASTYALSVTAKTVALGPPVSITAHTRPPVPSMEGILELVDSGNSSNLSMSDSPILHIHSSSINKDLLAGYLLVVIPQSADFSVRDMKLNENEWLAHELEQHINATFYVAAELIQDEWENDPAEVILGKGSDTKIGKWSLLWDPVLENEQQYRIGLVAILDYCGVLNIGYTATNILTVIY